MEAGRTRALARHQGFLRFYFLFVVSSRSAHPHIASIAIASYLSLVSSAQSLNI